jgi:NADH-quinone oxidoreductase subunit J
MLDSSIFWISSAVAIIATLMVLLSRNPFHAVLYLIVSLFGVAMIFYTLGAPFIAALEIIVYAGAIMVLFLFVVQMLSPASAPDSIPDMKKPSLAQLIFPAILASLLLAATVMALYRAGSLATTDNTNIVSARELGIALFKNHYLGVELASLILLIGIVGGMHLGRAAEGDEDTEEEAKVAVR